MDRFDLRRRTDGVTYHFERSALRSFSRVDDPRMRIAWEGPWGWLARRPDTGEIAGRPWDILPAHQSDLAPPQGLWISYKAQRSYAYDLVHLRG